MSRYILIRRLRGPAILLLIGVVALLHTLGVVEHFWHFWPLLLIVIGVFMLAERAALAAEGYPPFPGVSAAQYPIAYDPMTGQPVAQPPVVPQPGTSIVPAEHDFDSNGGRP